MNKNIPDELNCPHCGERSQIAESYYTTVRLMVLERGKVIERLQRAVHKQRERINSLRALVLHAGTAVRRMNAKARQQTNVDEQNRKLKEAIQRGSVHGIRIEPGEDRVEAMALIVRKVREHNMEQHRALTEISGACHSLLLSSELLEADETAVRRMEAIEVALSSVESVLNGSVSLTRQELDRQAHKSRDNAEAIRLVAVAGILGLEHRVGPVRKRDLKALRDKLKHIEV